MVIQMLFKAIQIQKQCRQFLLKQLKSYSPSTFNFYFVLQKHLPIHSVLPCSAEAAPTHYCCITLMNSFIFYQFVILHSWKDEDILEVYYCNRLTTEKVQLGSNCLY